MLGADPPERVGAIEWVPGRAEAAGEIGVEERAVPGLADLVDDRLLVPPDADLLPVHGERLPRVFVPRRRAVLVQALEVEVLDVSADIGDTPGVVGGRAEHDAGREGCRHPASLVAGRAEVELDPRARLLDEQVRIVREEGLAGGGPGARDRPLVRPLTSRRARELSQRSPARRPAAGAVG